MAGFCLSFPRTWKNCLRDVTYFCLFERWTTPCSWAPWETPPTGLEQRTLEQSRWGQQRYIAAAWTCVTSVGGIHFFHCVQCFLIQSSPCSVFPSHGGRHGQQRQPERPNHPPDHWKHSLKIGFSGKETIYAASPCCKKRFKWLDTRCRSRCVTNPCDNRNPVVHHQLPLKQSFKKNST